MLYKYTRCHQSGGRGDFIQEGAGAIAVSGTGMTAQGLPYKLNACAPVFFGAGAQGRAQPQPLFNYLAYKILKIAELIKPSAIAPSIAIQIPQRNNQAFY